ncbi:unnamed protein product [Dracunculus medinensis]|uniref:Uncharacterized protein n=1 Tax=Dracunculus medinensis TaxID=318479 RepID=A0A3P7PNJ4_DRAME|nr:unnamed protein product [Dracunculus medinensis]
MVLVFDFESLYYSLYVFTNAVIIGGPPPSYRSSTYGDESSSLSDFPNALKRRSSWLQLIENNENLQLRNAGAYPVSSYKKTTNNGFSFNFDNAIPLEQISPNNMEYSWLPPFSQRMGQQVPSLLSMRKNGNQIRFELKGGPPFRGDFISVYDFKNVAIIDSTLKNNGKNLACFLMDLNSTAMPDIASLNVAAKNSMKVKQTQGWEEAWYFVPTPYSNATSGFFNPVVPECTEVRWITLNYTILDQKGFFFQISLFNNRCTECYDFCLPEYGIEMDPIRGEKYLNILRRDCFHLFIPEWRSYVYSNEQNQLEFEKYYQNIKTNSENAQTNPAGIIYNIEGDTRTGQNFESKWISLENANRRNSFNAPVVSQEQHADNTKINSRLSPTALETVPIVQRPIEQNAPTYFSSQGRQSQEFQGQNRQVAVGDYNIKQTGNNPNEFGSRVIIMRSEQVPRPVSAQVFLFTLSFHY